MAERMPQIIQLFGFPPYDDIEEENLKQLYEAFRMIKANYKIIVSILEDSSITREKLRCLQSYSIDFEVLKTVYKREFSVWTNSKEKMGSLDDL
ncbi:hypothetical protein Calkro_2532 [Caldicellulosiruptor kronotskyensis 2002]|uniref:Uncharacterized protein n=2 Tax=Caldicellulosiruptor TaxID=44000 RepID=E4SHV7_CALK2|nr:hypothetical protein Calkro_2532 [Caldicellulosiruptor kronotskyensis 2002]